MSAPVDYTTLYSLTGDIKDINTLLVPASQLEAIGAGGVSTLRNTWMPDPDTQAVPVAQLSEPPEGCEWSMEPFRTWKEDVSNLHSAWFVVMPGGAMLQFNHHAIDAVDKARAKWVAAVCNAALGRS